MGLTLMLYLLSLKLAWATRHNAAFAEKAGARDFSLLIRTQDGRVGRLFVFCGGRLFSCRGAAHRADLAMVWKDAGVAVRTLARGDGAALPAALARGDLLLEGNGSIAPWFGDLVRLARGESQPLRQDHTDRIAMIGLGRMGSGIARNIADAGYALTVHNRTAAKAAALVERGARHAASPRAAVVDADIVVTSLMDDASLRDVVHGDDGLLAGLKRGAIHLCATTISPDLARELAEAHRRHGSAFVSGPVVGRPDAAASAQLVSFLAGEPAAVARCRALCAAYSQAVIVVGDAPALANTLKLCINYFLVASLDLMGQVYASAERAGIDTRYVAQFIERVYAHPTFLMYSRRIDRHDYDDKVGFELSGGLKDVNLMIDASADGEGSFDYAAAIAAKMRKAIEMGWSRRDCCAFVDVARTGSACR